MKKKYFIFALTALFCLAGCEDPNKNPWANVEAFIKTLNITNAGLSGGETISGVIDNEAFTVTFNNVPAETNIMAIKLDGKYSLGAKLDTTVYDFTEISGVNSKTLVHEVGITNYGDKRNVYTVTINLKDPENAPILEKLIMVDESGNEYPANIIAEDGTIYLGMEGKGSARLKNMVVTPARSVCTFSAMTDSVISESNPGTLTMDFLGMTTEYKIDFTSGSAGGIDFASAIVHDFSVATGNCPDVFAGELLRGSDFDGENVLLVIRADGGTTPAPKLYSVSSLLNNSLGTPTALDVTGVEGGTHVVSAGRLSQGHTYVCNLTTNMLEAPLKVYHWATPTSAPEVVLSWEGKDITNSEIAYEGRLGDNISVNLDEDGNGYAFFCKQEPGDKIFRFTVTNFTTFSDPYEIDLGAVCSYYGYVNEIAAEPGNFVFTASYVPFIRLMNADGETLYEMEMLAQTVNGARPGHSVDPRVVTFNRSRYLIYTVSNSQGMHWNFGPVMYMFDITDGFNTQSAFTKLDARMWPEDDSDSDVEPAYEYFIGAADGTTTASACTAQCAVAEVNGKLVVFTAGANAGFALIEFDKAK